MPETRRRTAAAAASSPSKTQPSTIVPPTSQHSVSKKNDSNTFKLTDVLRILGGLLLLNCALSYFVTHESVAWGWRPWFSKPASVRAWIAGPVRLSDAELRAFDGSDPTKPIYVALNGTIYDVTQGARFYGPGGSYHSLAGKDAARAFITGCFDTDGTPDLRGVEMMFVPLDTAEESVSKGELKKRRERDYRLAKKQVHDTIEGWAMVFRGDTGKDYFKVGEVVRPEGWLEQLPVPELCDRAQKARPKRKS